METLVSPSWLMAKGKNRVMERRTVLNIERHRKAFSAVRTSPVKPKTRKVHSRIKREAVKKKLKLKAL